MNESSIRARIFDQIARDPAGAFSLAKQNLEQHPESVEALLILADLKFMGVGDSRESARPLFEKVLRVDPDNVSALTGMALMPGLAVEESIVLLKRVTTIRGNALTYMNLGYKQWESGRYSEALGTFERVLDIARGERNQELVSSVRSAIGRIRKRQTPINYSYAVPN